ncbi:MAG: FAD-binding oxidoreductase [Cellvibrionaceae bacterium]
MPNKNSPKETVLSHVVGYQEVVDSQKALIKTGSDFSEHKGHVANTIAKLHPKRLSLKVTAIVDNTPSTKTLRVEAVNGSKLPPFLAGQYINLFATAEGSDTARPYAMSSSPADLSYYDLTVKRATPGFVTHHLLDQVQVGDVVSSTGPMGTFYHNPLFHGDQLVFLAGGSGIAPAMTMIRDIADHQKPQRFHLIYLSSYESDVIFEQELKELDQKHDFLTIDTIISRPTPNYSGLSGRLTTERLEELLGNGGLNEKMYFICGPTPFNESCRQQLNALNVKSRRIRIEANGPPKNPETLEKWPQQLEPSNEVTVTIQGKGSFKARVDEPLLNSMERNGYSAENACRSGECSLCRVKVVKGSVFNPPEAHLRKTDAQYGWCHSCVAFPTEDIEIIL